MVAFCDEVVWKIKGAANEVELQQVIQDSILQFGKTKESRREDAYLMNMIVTLKTTLAEELPSEAFNNVKKAKGIFRTYVRLNRGELF